MPRVFLVWLVLASVTGWLVYHLKYQVQQREAELVRLNQQIADEQDTIRVLRAEWAYLSQPGRVGELARKHLELQPVENTRLVSWGAIPSKAQLAAPPTPQTLPVVPPSGPGNGADTVRPEDDAPAGDDPSGASVSASPPEVAR